MRLKPGALDEYRRHHDNLWPELAAEIERAGIGSITTFQRDLDLFLVSEIQDESAWDNLWNSEVHRRWAEVMQPLMHLRDDGIVDADQLAEIFRFEIPTNGPAAQPAPKKAIKKKARKAARPAAKAKKKAAGKPAKKAARKTARKAAKKPVAKSAKKRSRAK
jgi:L-rhamnose mutarotase